MSQLVEAFAFLYLGLPLATFGMRWLAGVVERLDR